MARGTVVTARGQALNMEELIMAAKRPMSMKGIDQKDKVESKPLPARQLNIRGFVPSAQGVVAPLVEKPPVAEAKQPQEEGPTLADLTAVTLNGAKRLKEKPEDPNVAANETLREIMSDLEQYKARDAEVAAAKGQERRGRKVS